MTFTPAAREAIAPITREDRYAALLVCAFPGLMREPMVEDLLALLDFLEDA